MPIIAKGSASTGEFKPIAAGNYQAVCYDVWDIGLQKGSYNDSPTVAHKIIIAWEIEEEVEGGERMKISEFYTNSLNAKATLRKVLESWRGKAFTDEEVEAGFDIEKLIGANCLLNIVHKNDKARVAAVTAITKNMKKITPNAKRTMPEWVSKFVDKAISEEEAEEIREEIKQLKKSEKSENENGSEADDEGHESTEIGW